VLALSLVSHLSHGHGELAMPVLIPCGSVDSMWSICGLPMHPAFVDRSSVVVAARPVRGCGGHDGLTLCLYDHGGCSSARLHGHDGCSPVRLCAAVAATRSNARSLALLPYSSGDIDDMMNSRDVANEEDDDFFQNSPLGSL
jgi:hypothetical protein